MWEHCKLIPCLSLLALTACSGDTTGRSAVEDVGCASCHVIPGISWPRGTVGPSLEGFGDRQFIAGKLVNEAENLERFVRDATSVVPDGAMPPIAMSDSQAREIARYLLTLRAE